MSSSDGVDADSVIGDDVGEAIRTLEVGRSEAFRQGDVERLEQIRASVQQLLERQMDKSQRKQANDLMKNVNFSLSNAPARAAGTATQGTATQGTRPAPASPRIGEEAKGYNGILVLEEGGVTIRRGKRGFAAGGLFARGDKFIPYGSIVAVQLKKPGVGVGYLQLSLRGGSEAKRGLGQAARDENTVTFQTDFPKWERTRDLIMKRAFPDLEATKVCPDCAEIVKEAAKVCRFCGYRFESSLG
jgi:Uncharacterised protein family UPF0547/Domain of unknown function (DUF4429)